MKIFLYPFVIKSEIVADSSRLELNFFIFFLSCVWWLIICLILAHCTRCLLFILWPYNWRCEFHSIGFERLVKLKLKLKLIYGVLNRFLAPLLLLFSPLLVADQLSSRSFRFILLTQFEVIVCFHKGNEVNVSRGIVFSWM